MTEAEWLGCASPVAMLHHLNADGYERKPLLYAAAVCRRLPELLTDVLRAWLEVIEDAADGDVTTEDLDREQEGAESESYHLAEHGPTGTRAQCAAIADVVGCTWINAPVEYDQDNPLPPDEATAVRRANAELVRDIFGNPFRPVTFAPVWRTDTAVALARQMYDSREFSAMPILADALQDAGCNNDDVLNHCRGDRPHVRGCWVVDLVLGKS